MKKRGLNILLALVCVCIFTCIAFAVDDGMTFRNYGIYKTKEPLSVIPTTYEAWVRIPAGYTASSGKIISNADFSTRSAFDIYAYTNGSPVLKFINKTPDGEYATQKTYQFTEINIATGKWVHLAFVHDTDAGNLYCYIDGKLSGTKKIAFTPERSPFPLVLGGCNSTGNEDYFKGYIRSVTLYTDVRTADEIKADMAAVDVSDAHLLAHYDLAKAEWGKDIPDAAGNYDMVYNKYWYDEAPALPEYAYSIAVIGDQQTQLYRFSDTLHFSYDWLLANKDSKKISYVVNVGDYTQTLTGKASEYELAISQFKRLSGQLPLIVCRGNHEVASLHNQYMNYPGYTADIAGRYNNELIDIYKTAKIGDTDYLFITLDFGPTDAELEWANEIVAAHPSHKVIVVVHGYMTRDGTTLDENDNYSPSLHDLPNNGKTIWEKFASKHENIVLVLSGHVGSDYIPAVKAVGEKGNVVTQMLINQQGIDLDTPTGMICMLYFNADGNVVNTEYYSTVRKQYLLIEDNNYTMYIGERSGDADADGRITLKDVLAALSSAMGGEIQKNADADGDGKITLKDALLIMQTAVKGE